MSASLGLILVVFVNLVASCVFSLLESWKLALVAIFGSLPVIILAGYLHVKLESSSQVQDQKIFHDSASFISEVAASMKTVASLNMERYVCNKLDQKLRGPMNRAYKKAAMSMTLFAFSQSASLLGEFQSSVTSTFSSKAANSTHERHSRFGTAGIYRLIER